MQAVPIMLAVATSLLLSPAVEVTDLGVAMMVGGHDPASVHLQESQEPIDVNKASEEELELIPGVGPAMAQRIITWREENGRFERVEDLLNIRGIGVKTLEKLRPYVVVHPQSATGRR